MGVVMVAIVVMMMMGVGLGALMLGGPSAPAGPDDMDALTVCQQFVEKQLKAPSTAEFSGHIIKNSNPDWTVTGDVDAENAFGVMLRNRYVCNVSVNPDGKTWRLTGLNLADQ